MNISKLNDVTWCDQNDPEYDHSNDYLSIWQQQSLFKMLFCVLARYAITPICFKNLAISCKTGRDACREFAAMKRHLLLTSVKCDSLIRQFLPNGLCHGVSLGTTNSHYHENGVELYSVIFGSKDNTYTFKSCDRLPRHDFFSEKVAGASLDLRSW
jgi:hypothetical protein